jgi:hypothetical protein
MQRVEIGDAIDLTGGLLIASQRIETHWAKRHNPDWGLSMILHAAIGGAIVFPVGVLVGYLWRDRISRARRDRYLAERRKRKSAALRPKDVF